jgi:hypothetical protein
VQQANSEMLLQKRDLPRHSRLAHVALARRGRERTDLA